MIENELYLDVSGAAGLVLSLPASTCREQGPNGP